MSERKWSVERKQIVDTSGRSMTTESVRIVNENGGVIALVKHAGKEAAPLLAAAPDLYEALDEAISYLAIWAASTNGGQASVALDRCTAALAKATVR